MGAVGYNLLWVSRGICIVTFGTVHARIVHNEFQ